MINQILVTITGSNVIVHPMSRVLDTPLTETQITAALETQFTIDSFDVNNNQATVMVTPPEGTSSDVPPGNDSPVEFE